MTIKKANDNNPISGWLSVDKPADMSSFAVVAKIRKLLGIKKIGHAGTLDPLATGVLPIAIGQATKTIQYAMDADKSYAFTVKWGEQTDSDDSEGMVTSRCNTIPSLKDIQDAIPYFLGTISQIPPKFSAIKVNGVRSYKLARAGKDYSLQERQVTIADFKLLSYEEAITKFYVKCTKGTYVRALARDLAAKLSTYAHIVQLKRLSSGNFNIKDAISLVNIEHFTKNGTIDNHILPCCYVLAHLPSVQVSKEQAKMLINGQKVKIANFVNFFEDNCLVCVYNGARFVGISKIRNDILKPVKIFK